MKKLNLLLTGVLSATLLLGACGNEEAEKTHENKTESVDKKNEALKEEKIKQDRSKQEEATQQQPATQESTEEPVTQEKATPEKQQSDEDIMGPGDPNYKPDPRFTEGPEGYDPVEGAKDPNKDEFTFKQQPENTARDQVINEGIDMDNPSDAEIERMRELSKDSPHGLQTAP